MKICGHEELHRTIIFYTNYYDVPLSGYLKLDGKIWQFENVKFPYWDSLDGDEDNAVYIDGEWELIEVPYWKYLRAKIRVGVFYSFLGHYRYHDRFLRFCFSLQKIIPEYASRRMMCIWYGKSCEYSKPKFTII